MNLIKKAIILIGFCSSIYASGTTCLTHAQCQGYITESTGCFLIRGENNTCEEQCFPIETSSYCHKENGSNFGTCTDESLNYKSVKLNAKEDCKNAISKVQLENII